MKYTKEIDSTEEWQARLIVTAPELLQLAKAIIDMKPMSHDDFTRKYGFSQGGIVEHAAKLIAKVNVSHV